MKRINIFWKLNVTFIVAILLILITLNLANDLIGTRYNADEILSGGVLPSLTAFAIIVVMSCLFTWLFVRFYIRPPVRRLVGGMHRLAEKEFDFRLEEDDRHEFGELAAAFNDMAAMLTSSLHELKKNRDYLSNILESSADIIVTVNASGKIQTINSGAEKVLGYRQLEVMGQPVEILFADPREREIAVEKLEDSDNVVNFETRFVTANGRVKDVLLTLSRLRNPAGAIIGTIGISKDITEEKRLQHQLIQSQRYAAIGQVFTGIQHSMKNMLNACQGGAYMVRTGLAKDNQKMLEEGWTIVQEGISSLTRMSLDMLKYVKEWKPRFDRTDLCRPLNEIYRVIGQTAKDKGVTMCLDIAPELPRVDCDAGMIQSAVMDIVSNALDACLWKDYADGEIPQVAIRAYPSDDGERAVIEVRDNGCGMTDEVKENIFAPFFSTKSRAGTGLGLSITSRMISVHGGTIDVDSEPNCGTVFRIGLPIDGTNRNKEKDNGKKGSGG